MNERLTWDEIVEKYPNQWVGLIDVDWEDGANVRSADNLAPLGVVGYMG